MSEAEAVAQAAQANVNEEREDNENVRAGTNNSFVRCATNSDSRGHCGGNLNTYSVKRALLD